MTAQLETRLSSLVEAYLHELRQQGYASGTVENRRIYLWQFLSFLKSKNIAKISRDLISQYQFKLSKEINAPLTRRDKLSTLKLFLSWLYKRGFIFSDLSKAVKFPRHIDNLPKQVLNQNEMKYFLSLPKTKSQKGIRDKAILELLYSAAIRRAELCGLNLYDLNCAEQTLRVLGKGKKERLVPVGDTALFWLLRYIQQVRNPSGAKEKALFLGMAERKRLKVKMLNLVIHEYAIKSSLNKKVTPHIFRHSCATHLIKNGADIRYVQQLLGHKSIATTQVYTRVAIADLEKVFRSSHPRAKK